MSDRFLGGRGKALEDAFFARQDAELRQRLRATGAAERGKAALSAVSGITDDALLGRLVALDIAGDTLAALSLVPVVVVAWADGSIDDRERAAVLAAATEVGVDRQSASYELLDRWLATRPSPELLAAWKSAARGFLDTADREAAPKLRTELLDRARAVAEAAGGLLGMGRKISAAERAALDDLDSAFGG